MGLFDTVTSVGPVPSGNNIGKLELEAPLEVKLASRLSSFKDTRPDVVAFGVWALTQTIKL
jgi:hypothetical protein